MSKSSFIGTLVYHSLTNSKDSYDIETTQGKLFMKLVMKRQTAWCRQTISTVILNALYNVLLEAN